MITAGCLAQANWLLGSKSKIVPSLKWLSAEICVVLSMVATIKTPTQQETKGTLGFMKKICPLLRAQSAMHESISQMAFQTPWTRHKWCRRETATVILLTLAIKTRFLFPWLLFMALRIILSIPITRFCCIFFSIYWWPGSVISFFRSLVFNTMIFFK